MSNEKKRKLHLSRIPAVGTSVLTKCGRQKNTGTFTNPNAKLCPQCVALSEADGLTINVKWVVDSASSIPGTPAETGHWSVSATPPMIERQGNLLIDRNNPDAPAVYLDVNKVLALSDVSLDEYYEVHGPRSKELTAG